MKTDWPNLALGMLASSGLVLMVAVVAAGDKTLPTAAPAAAPAAKPFPNVVSGAGIIEPISESIAIGTPTSGLVEKVHVGVGQLVEAGDMLFALDHRQIDADIVARSAGVEVARSRLAEVSALESEANDQLARVRALPDQRAVSQEEIIRREIAAAAAGARAKASRALLEQAQADLNALKTEKSRMIIRAPISGEVLQINIRKGEFATAGSVTPILVMGDTRRYHARIDVDENDAWRVRSGARAVVYVRGNTALSAPAEFVRIEPFVIPKRSLTGQAAERIDTRVLQVLFSIPRQNLPLYIGQQVDAFIEAERGV